MTTPYAHKPRAKPRFRITQDGSGAVELATADGRSVRYRAMGGRVWAILPGTLKTPGWQVFRLLQGGGIALSVHDAVGLLAVIRREARRCYCIDFPGREPAYLSKN